MNSLEMYKAWNVLKFHRSFPFIPHFATCSHYWIAVCNLLVFTKAFAKCPCSLLLKKPLKFQQFLPTCQWTGSNVSSLAAFWKICPTLVHKLWLLRTHLASEFISLWHYLVSYWGPDSVVFLTPNLRSIFPLSLVSHPVSPARGCFSCIQNEDSQSCRWTPYRPQESVQPHPYWQVRQSQDMSTEPHHLNWRMVTAVPGPFLTWTSSILQLPPGHS